jgi:hypothetical protein
MSKKTSKPVQPESGSLVAAEDIRSKMTSRDLLVSDRLESRPIVGLEKDLVLEPVGDVLLFDRPVHRLRKSLGKGRLATARNLDRAQQRGDVSSNLRFIHEHKLYTNQFVLVKQPVCVTDNKQACTVLQMPTTQRKGAARAPSNQRIAIPGPDGKTLGQRVNEAMAFEAGRRRASYAQKDLIEDVNRLVVVEGEAEVLFSQAMASAIMNNKVTRSSFTPYIAKACHVDAVWLARGTGQMIPKG